MRNCDTQFAANGLKYMNNKILLSHFSNISAKNWRDWRWQFQNRVTSMTKLTRILGRSMPWAEKLRPVLSAYPMAITPYYLSLFEQNEENNPLALQCIPDLREISVLPNSPADPLNEDGCMPAPKLIHRYPDRALAMVTKTCAMHCRHAPVFI